MALGLGTKAESNALRGLSMDSKGVTQPGLERTSCGDFQTGQFVRGTRVLPRGLRLGTLLSLSIGRISLQKMKNHDIGLEVNQ